MDVDELAREGENRRRTSACPGSGKLQSLSFSPCERNGVLIQVLVSVGSSRSGRSGSLALLDIGGYKIAVPAGSASTGTPLQVDLAVTGSTEPGNLRAETLITRMACDWQGRQTADVYYGPRSVRLLLRPGRSAVLKGGNYALQQDAVA